MKQSIYLASLLALSAAAGQYYATAVPVTGQVQGFQGVQNGDNVVDGALVVPSVRPRELISLQLGSLISPNEPMPAGPVTVQIPGNLYFPRQTENYGFFTVELKKERFTHMAPEGVSNELAALSFKASFQQLVDAGQNNVPLVRMLGLIKLDKLGFESDRDWSKVSSPVNLALNQASQKNLSYNWTRPAAPANATDLAVSFQATPAGRWLVTGLVGSAPKQGQLGSFANLGKRMRLLLGRVYDSANKNEKLPASAVGWFSETSTGATVTANGLPEGFKNLSTASNRGVLWGTIEQPGWVAILRWKGGVRAEQNVNQDNFLGGLSLGLDRLAAARDISARIEAWVPAAAGQFAYDTTTQESLGLVFVGTDRVVPSPTEDTAEEPALFTYATDFKFARMF